MSIPSTEMTLASLKPGQEAKILSISQGRMIRQRLLNLGILPGEEVLIIRGGGTHPLVLEIRGTKVALGAGMAAKVSVIPISS